MRQIMNQVAEYLDDPNREVGGRIFHPGLFGDQMEVVNNLQVGRYNQNRDGKAVACPLCCEKVKGVIGHILKVKITIEMTSYTRDVVIETSWMREGL